MVLWRKNVLMDYLMKKKTFVGFSRQRELVAVRECDIKR